LFFDLNLGINRREEARSMTIVSEATNAGGRLNQLGLVPQILRDSVLAGQMARAQCTENDPPPCQGFIAWARTVRSLRELLIPRGFTRSESGRLSTVVAPGGEFAIAVAVGDAATGDASRQPKTKNARGPATCAAVDTNQKLLIEGVLASAEDDPDPKRPTWYLLIAEIDAELRVELSLPLRVGEDDRIEEWQERILLPPILLGDDTLVRLDLSPELDVRVTPRANGTA
jgi:hypothetical protein